MCPIVSDAAPDLLADYAAWRPVAVASERVEGGWRLWFSPPPAGMFRMQCRSGSLAVAPRGFTWVEDDGFGGQNGVGFAAQVTAAAQDR